VEKKLSERKRKILHALVDSYIHSQTAEPIASSQIRQNYLPEVSSATIRSELAALEELGYLLKPHISAGRIPSSQAYKYYVEGLINDGGLAERDAGHLQSHFEVRLTELDDVVRQTAKVVADKTNYTSLVLLNNYDELVIKSVRLVDLGSGQALIVIVTDAGIVKDNFLELPQGMREDYLEACESILNEIFRGRNLHEAAVDYKDYIDERMLGFRIVFERVVEIFSQLREERQNTLYLEGATKIMEHPEYNDISDVKRFMGVLDGGKINQIIGGDEDIEFSVKIGKDDSSELQNMALVTAKYMISGKEVGRVGVIGPERMNYKQVIKVLKNVQKATKRIVRQSEKTNKGEQHERR
jgi:heat-inducible transcriptional repressor